MGNVASEESKPGKAASSPDDVWTIKRALDWIQGYLERKGDPQPRLSAQWLLAEVTSLTRMQLYVNLDRVLTADELARLHTFVARRASGEPLQYITGEVGFRHITLKVRPGVLIPRPETEVLVSEALSLLPRAKRPRAFDDRFIEALASGASAVDDDVDGDSADDDALDSYAGVKRAMKAAREALSVQGDDGELIVVDVGTGSGCIACSIAAEHASTRVIACDISPEALSLARENVALLGLGERVSVIESDIGDGVNASYLGNIDLVVSNPPYIPRDVLGTLSREVSDFEPQLALDGGPDGLDVYRRLIAWCQQALKPGGACAFELHETCLDQARDIAQQAGFSDVRIVDDLAGKPRVLTAVKPKVLQ